MASYRPYAPPQSSFAPPPPNTNPLPPPPHPQPPRGQFSQNWGYGGSGSSGGGDGSNYCQQQPYSSSSRQPQQPPPPHYPYAQPPPPPPPDSSYPPPPPPPPGQNSGSLQPPQPPSMYYASNSQYSQYNSQQAAPPPPPPSSPPPNSVAPPPPPPSSPPPPPPPQSKESRGPEKKPQEPSKGPPRGRFDHGVSAKQTKPPVPAARKPNGNPGRAETEEERRLRKKREYEKLRQEEKHKQQLKESQNSVLQKAQILSSGKGHGSIVGSRMGDRRATPLLGGDRTENRLKKPTTFLCKMKFRNELPDPSAQMKLMSLKKDKERFTKYTITSLEKMWKPKLYVEPDLGIPLDLLDLSVYNPPAVRPHLAPEDEELLYDDAVSTPIKNSGIKRKERPTDIGMSWLIKTQYISPISLESAKQSLTEKQAKELKESKGRNILENSRERQIKEIEASFVAAKTRPVHATNKNLYPVEVWPLFPDFDRYKDPLVVASFDSAPTADSQTFSKLDHSTRDEHESKAIMKSYMASGSDPSNPEKFLAYMVPSTDELSKDPFDEDEDINYTWIREYNWDVRGDDVADPTTYLVAFDDGEARYLPLPTKLNLRKKRAREGRAGEEVEHFPVPASITVRRRPNVASIELKDESGGYSSRKGTGMSGSKMRDDDMDDEEDGLDDSPERDDFRHLDPDQYSGGDDDLSD